jgi:hypothetical protein
MTKTQPQGTPIEGAYDSYTAEQLAALEEIKDRKYALGIAKASYVNNVLHADGSFSKDVTTLEKSAKAEVTKLASGDLTDPDHLRKMELAARRLQEITSHIAQERFLFVVNGDKIVYFQCATSKAKIPAIEAHEDGKLKMGSDGKPKVAVKTMPNPDMPPMATDEDRASQQEHGEEVKRLVAQAHERAARRRAAANVGVIEP